MVKCLCLARPLVLIVHFQRENRLYSDYLTTNYEQSNTLALSCLKQVLPKFTKFIMKIKSTFDIPGKVYSYNLLYSTKHIKVTVVKIIFYIYCQN